MFKLRSRPDNKPDVKDIVNDIEHKQRINNVLNIKEYLLRKHKVLQRPDFMFKEEEFITAKIVLQSIKSIIDAHVSYVIGNPVSISGEKSIVCEYNKLYKKGGINKTDYEITEDIYKYGNAFEYIYLDGDAIKSKAIANEDSYPVYDDRGNYTHFIEHWKNVNGNDYSNIYYPDKVDEYVNGSLIRSYNNLTGLPIHYAAFDKSAFNHFGDSMLNDLIPICDEIEALLSKMSDSITTLSLNPLGVITGKLLNTNDVIPKDLVGAVINLDEGDFKYAVVNLDYNSIKLLLDMLIQQFYTVAGIPSVIMGQSNVANVSEVSLKMFFNATDAKAKKTIYVLKQGMYKRFEYIRKLLELQGKHFTDEEFDTLDINFNVNRPVDTNSMMKELKTQFEMGSISKQTVIDISPYTTDTALEMQRINEEQNKITTRNEVNINEETSSK